MEVGKSGGDFEKASLDLWFAAQARECRAEKPCIVRRLCGLEHADLSGLLKCKFCMLGVISVHVGWGEGLGTPLQHFPR